MNSSFIELVLIYNGNGNEIAALKLVNHLEWDILLFNIVNQTFSKPTSSCICVTTMVAALI